MTVDSLRRGGEEEGERGKGGGRERWGEREREMGGEGMR